MKQPFIKPLCHAILWTLIALSSPVSAQSTPTTTSPSHTTKTAQAPGYFRSQVGTMQVTALFDGSFALPASTFTQTTLSDTQKRWQAMYDYTTDGVPTTDNAYLINTGNQVILVDAGAASCFGPSLGRLSESLKTAGYQTSDINTVLITHLHPDHVCGLLDSEGQRVFKNADVYVNEKEVAYWSSTEEAQKAPKDHQKFFSMAQNAIAPYQKAGQLKTFNVGDQIVDGIQSIAEYGHTPGHTGYLFQSGAEKMLIWGDLVHSYSLQLRNPKIAMAFDQNQSQAVETRQRILAKTASEGILVGGAHMPFPGLGHVVTEGNGYAWVPTQYLPTK